MSKRNQLYLITFIVVAVVGAAIALFAIFLMPKMAIVKFVDAADVQEQEIADSIEVRIGSPLPADLPTPSKTGHTFDAWYHSKQINDESKVKPGEDIVESDTTLYANFVVNKYTITFNKNGAEGTEPLPLSEAYGGKVVLPTETNSGLYMPTKVLYGWCLDPNGNDILYDPGQQIYVYPENVTLYAIWGNPRTVVNYVVGEGATFINPKTFETNNIIPDEGENRVDAYKEGYNFIGWFTDETYSTQIDFDTFVLTGNEVSIYAKFEAKQFTVTYKIYNDETLTWDVWEISETPQIHTIYYDGKVTRPALTPTKVGKVFIDWYIDDTLLAKYNFDTLVTGNRTLYAKWGDIPPVADETAATAFEYVKNDENQTVSIISVKDPNINALVFPREIDGYRVVEIQGGVRNLEKLTVVKIPYTIEVIADNAFSSCPLIQEYQLISESNFFKTEAGVLYSKDGTKLCKYPASKEGLNYTTLQTTQIVGSHAFDNAQYLQSLTLNATTIQANAFLGCTSINNLVIGENVTTISDGAFMSFYSLVSVTSSSPLFQVYDGGIYNANQTKLIKYFGKDLNKSYESPANLTEINQYAFDGCSNIVSVTLSANVTTFGSYAFSDCTSLKSLTFAAVTGTAQAGLISGCTALETITCHATNSNAIYVMILTCSEVQANPVTFVQI